jgi:chromate transporter
MNRLAEVGIVFLRLSVTAFGGPAAHIALIHRECVERRRWISRAEFLDLLGVANLIPGPTSTELAMHVGRLRAGWPGLVVAGVAFVAPAAVLVAALAAVYVRAGELPVARGVLAAVQPVVVVIVLQALVPLARSAITSIPLLFFAVAVALLGVAGVPEIRLLIGAGVAHLIVGRSAALVVLFAGLGGSTLLAAAPSAAASLTDLAGYFLRTGALLFGSGYVLLPVLQDDLVARYGWITQAQLLDALAAGQATPGPVFTTATFIGYVLGGPLGALVATVAIFLPAFIFSAVSSATLERLRTVAAARAFLVGVNAAAVALIALVLVTLARAAFTGPLSIAMGLAAAVAVLMARVNQALVLAAAAAIGAALAAL